MKPYLSILFVVSGAAMLLRLPHFVSAVSGALLANTLIDSFLKYQIAALLLAISLTAVTWFLHPVSRNYLQLGSLHLPAEQLKWMGISGQTNWTVVFPKLLLWVSLPTLIFMFLGVWSSQSLHAFQWKFIPWVLLFSFTNALTEELIFRFVLLPVQEVVPTVKVICLVSAILFGLPHFWGNPGGAIGVVMSGILGFVLMKMMLETKGLLAPWLLHFIQDVIIFTAIFMMSKVGLE